MKSFTCALCGRPMARASYTIGALAVGPSCGKRAGFAQLSRKRAGVVRSVGRVRAGRVGQGETLDLFEGVGA